MSRLMVAAALMVSGGCSQPEPPPDTQTTIPVPDDDDGIRRSREVLTAEYKAVVLIEHLGGSVAREGEKPRKPVVSVDLSGTKVTDAELAVLVPLTSLTTINLSGTQVTDVGVKELAALQNLNVLTLSGTKVTDAGVKELQKALPKCEIASDPAK